MKFKQSEVIVECEPFAHCVADGEEKRRCHYCLEDRNSLKSCSRCKVARYCSKQCQAKDWQNVHQMECKILKKDSERPQPALFNANCLRLVLRIILILKKYPEKEFEMVDTYRGPRNFHSLMNQVGENSQESEGNEATMNYLSNLFCLSLEDLKNSPVICRMVNINGFFIKSKLGEMLIGYGLYIAASVFDHNCSPNSIKIFEGIRAQIVAMKDFDTESEAPLISFVDPRYSKEHRQAALMAKYSFLCSCSRCLSTNKTLNPDIIQMQRDIEPLEEQGKLVEAFEQALRCFELALEILPILYPPLLLEFQSLKSVYAILKSKNYSVNSHTSKIEKYSSMILSTHSPLLERYKLHRELSVFDSYGNIHLITNETKQIF